MSEKNKIYPQKGEQQIQITQIDEFGKSLALIYLDQIIEMSDQESKDQKFRNFLDRWVYSPSTSKLIATFRQRSSIFIGLISFVSSLAFVILSYWDFSLDDPCCS